MRNLYTQKEVPMHMKSSAHKTNEARCPAFIDIESETIKISIENSIV